MIEQLDTTHRYTSRGRRVQPTVLVGVGGSGREMARAGAREIEAHFGCPVPHVLLAEFDLCDSTGRSLEAPYQAQVAGTYMSLVLPDMNPREAVSRHRADERCDWWKVVDPDVVQEITNTGKLGGYASPQTARFAQEFYSERIEDFCASIAARVDAMREQRLPAWEQGGPLQVVVYGSLNGAVGSTALHFKDRLERHLTKPFRMLHVAGLLADRGRVTDRQRARALQQAGLTEVHLRCTQS